jgi:class 3 adenylate cyclase
VRLAFSFRFKLLTAMMLLVAGVTGSTMVVAQQRVRATYRRLYSEQFQRQIQFLAALREERNRQAQLKALSMATESVRIRAALEEGDVDLLYRTAADELREVVRPGRVAAGQLQVDVYRFLDAQGDIIEPPPGLGGFKTTDSSWHLTHRIENLARVIADPAPQQVGVAVARRDDGDYRLLDLIVTKISDPVDRHLLGLLVVGFQMPGAIDEVLERTGRIKSGILVNGEVFSLTITNSALRSRILKHVSAVAGGDSSVDRDTLIDVDGLAHRLFFQAINPGSVLPTSYVVGLYSLSDATREERELRIRAVAMGGVALLGALAIGFLLSHNLALPIRDLVAGTTEVRQGNFGVRLRVRARDELGQLTESFNEMTDGLAQKERYRSVLNLVADKSVAEELLRGEVKLGGETRDVSVLFCDIRGFTALTQGMESAEVIHLLNEHFTPLARVVTENGGVVDKYVGDLIMAVFGAPKSRGDEALRAARCALQMIEERDRLNAGDETRHRVAMGIGIASGRVVAGCTGSTERLNYTVLGERVNLASRLCAQARAMEIVIDDLTRERLGSRAEVEAMPPLTLKGFTGSVSAFKLRRVASE